MSELNLFIESLSPQQKAAINLVKLSLDCFNSVDGTGMFTGVERYNVLAGRIEICATQADNLLTFWSFLLKKMLWPIPPKSADGDILAAIKQQDQQEILRVMATETASVITLARMLHDQEKAANRKLANQEKDAFEKSAGELDDGLFN